MYPFRAIILGPTDSTDALAAPFANSGIAIDGRFADLAALRAGWTPDELEPCLFAIWLQRPEDTAVVREVNETQPGCPILALVEQSCDTAGMYEISRAGASQIVPVPWEESDLASALSAILRQFGRAARVGKLIAVASVPERDTAAFAVNLAYEIASRWNLDCILAEPTARMARLNSYLESTPHVGAQELLTQAESLTLTTVQQALTPVADRLRLLPGPLHGIALQSPDLGRLGRLIDVMRQLSSCVVLNVPNTFDAAQFAAIACAEHVILVGGQQIPALHSLKLLRQALSTVRMVGTQHIVLHHYDPSQGGADAQRAREMFSATEVWTVTHDPVAWTAAINEGVPLREKSPRSHALTDLDRLIAHLLGPRPAD